MGPEIAQKIELEREKKRSRTVFRPAATFRAAGSVFAVVFCVFIVHGFFEKLREARRNEMACRLVQFYGDVYSDEEDLWRPEARRPEELFVESANPEEGASGLEYKVLGGGGWEEGEEHGEEVVRNVLERSGELEDWKEGVADKLWMVSGDFCGGEEFLSWGFSREFAGDVEDCLKSVIPLPGGLRAGRDFEHIWKIQGETDGMEPLRRAFGSSERWAEFRLVYGDTYMYLRPEFVEDVLLYLEKLRTQRSREVETAWCGIEDSEIEAELQKEDPTFRLPRPSVAWSGAPEDRGARAPRDLFFCLDRFGFFFIKCFGISCIYLWALGLLYLYVGAVGIFCLGFALDLALSFRGLRMGLAFTSRSSHARLYGTFVALARRGRSGWWETSLRSLSSISARWICIRTCGTYRARRRGWLSIVSSAKSGARMRSIVSWFLGRVF